MESHTHKAILPGATIGILGGGQLGRMVAMAARSLGYRIQVLDPIRHVRRALLPMLVLRLRGMTLGQPPTWLGEAMW